MARLTVIFVALATVVFGTRCDDVHKISTSLSLDANEVKQIKGIPYVVESNLPASFNNLALAAAQQALDSSPNLIVAAQQLVLKVASYDATQKWNVAIQPLAYSIERNYFAHYVVNNYHVFLYSVQCHY